MNLSLGNPDLVPVEEIRNLKSKFQLQSELALHTYAEDNNLNQFCEGMVRAFTGVDYKAKSHLRAVPIAGIKTASAILPLACGLHLKDRKQFHVVSHLPAYDVIGTWSSSYLATNRIVWPLSSHDSMKMNLQSLKASLKSANVEKPDLIFVIRPGNPASTGASREEWKELIEFLYRTRHSARERRCVHHAFGREPRTAFRRGSGLSRTRMGGVAFDE